MGRAESQQTAEGIWLQPAQQASGLDRPGSRFFFRNQPGLPDKGGHFLDEGIGTAQLFERFPCPLLPQREQKCRQPGGHLRQAFGQGVDDGPGRFKPRGVFRREQLRQHHRKNGGLHPRSGLGRCQQAGQFLRDPLGGDAVQMGTELPRRLPGSRVDFKAKPRREPVESQDAEGILGKALVGHAHSPDKAPGQVFLPAKGVDKPLLGAVGHGVDGKIPPGQVFFHVRHKSHGIRVAAIRVAALGAESRRLVEFSTIFDRHGAVL